ncbi:PREDICTED: chymotrypsin-2-like [Ceratosolen solmsi marchali]|uniref:Chymotrypsin-2-like n=1 Tax=Ceratosolen solmsi marchali TaxID=326594 RepID=A0AAJ6VNA1_9HYME|nr:PREDICTED: chymotrypsin-2-like [Ceratosolen solmsi marchali]
MTSSQNIRHVCAGTLVSFKHVLTAEHCLVNRNTTLIKVIVGSTYLIMGRRHSILWWIGFDHWSSQLNIRPTFMMNDIAIIKLKVRINSSIIPATLSNYENSAIFGLNVEIAGWGISNTGEVAPIMEKIKVTVLSKDECEARASILAEEELRFESVLFCTAANPFALVKIMDKLLVLQLLSLIK